MIALVFLLLLLLLLLFTPHSSSHQPFFPAMPVTDSPPPPPLTTTQPPSPSPSPQPKHTFFAQTPPTTTHHHHNHRFFPFYTSPSSSTTIPSPSLPTFPANISSIIIPPSSTSKPSSVSRKLLLLSLTISLLSVAFIAAVVASLLYYRKHNHNHQPPTSDGLRLFPPNIPASDKPPPPPTLPPNFSTPSSEFLYLGTLVSPGRPLHDEKTSTHTTNAAASSTILGYKRLGSPELQPLPPLPRHNVRHQQDLDEGSFTDPEEFFSPKGSPGDKRSPCVVDAISTGVFQATQRHNIHDRSSNSRTGSYLTSNPAYPTHTVCASPSVVLNLSPTSLRPKSPDPYVRFPASIRPSKSPSPPSSPTERYAQNTPGRSSDVYVPVKLPPPPPPMPPPGFWETHVEVQEPTMGPVASESQKPAENEQRKEEILKPKLKALHWDKVRASSERAMVWDQLKFSSFQLNEEMIETLFMANSSKLAPMHSSNQPMVVPMATDMNQKNRVLDPHKSRNIAILLRAFNLTVDEVCECILQGNVDTVGTELLGSLLKMAPTMEEEVRLKEFNDASHFKLGPAEKFLKVVIDIPFAFKRVDAMLYISSFDTEVDYLKRSFETIESACQQLRNSRMFIKLLEAVLKAGNRMNIGTNHGDAHAFKLDTLLKLIDVKGTNGKTTLLHFVVQEIARAEGCCPLGADHNLVTQVNKQSALCDEVVFRKLGLEVVSSLSGELSSVKKAATMDSDLLSKEVGRLAMGITKIGEVVALNEQLGSNKRFSDSMNMFLKKAEDDIIKIEAEERQSISMVKETSEYFHGNSAKEEAQPLRIFMVVRDFLSVLDQVCKEVRKINERTTVGNCGRDFPLPLQMSQSLSVFPRINRRQHIGPPDGEDDSTSA